MANLSNINNKFLVTTGGNVLIGKTAVTGTSKLQVSGSLLIGTDISSGIPLVVQETTADGFAIGFMRNTNTTNGNGLVIDVNSTGGAYIQDWRQASTVKMRLLQNGNLGIGTDSPDSPLEIQNVPAQGSQKRMLHLDANHTGNQGSTFLEISAGTSTGANTKIEMVSGGGQGLFGTYVDTNIINSATSSGAYGNINFVTGSSTSATSIVMTIGGGSQKGNVGIGDTTPTSKLTILGTSTAASNTPSDAIVDIHGTSTAHLLMGVANVSPYGAWINTDATGQPLVLQGVGGNVGIGTDSPGAKLDVVGYAQIDSYTANDSGNNPFNSGYLKLIAGAKTGWGVGDQLGKIEFYGTDTSGIGARTAASIISVCEDGNGTSTTTFSSGLAFYTSSYNANQSEKLRIDNDGNVGIGETSPSSKLHVVDGNNYAKLGDLHSNSTMSLRMADNSGFPVEVQAYGTELRFNTATTTGATPSVKMNILPNGNVGIGETSPSFKLDVNVTSSRARFKATSGDANIELSSIAGHDWLIQSKSDSSLVIYNEDEASARMVITGGTGAGEGSTMINYTNSNIETYGSGAYSGKLIVKAHTTTPNAAITCLNGNVGGDNPVFINFVNEFVANQYNYLARIAAAPENTWTGTASTRNASLNFYTNSAGTSAERMRITSVGRILMPGLDGKTQVHPDVSYRTSDGELFYQTSSERYKTDIVDLENCLDKVNSLRTVRFTDTNTNEPGFGLIAEETNEIIPDVVFSRNEQIEGISYSNLVPFLIKSIQELKAEIELLKSK